MHAKHVSATNRRVIHERSYSRLC